ncbi:MAG TPA: DUF1385 domain-containing protein [Ktedonobacterales bacterium]|nr:DUF1385 domain-containing protein [Ktedonobacterales bacterium]
MAKFYYGGQAVIEGVMMRGRRSAAVAVRQPTGGILLHEEQLPKRVYGAKVATWPFVRGVLLLWDMLVLGTRMMLFASSVAMPLDESANASQPAGRPLPTAAPGTVAETNGAVKSTDARLVLTVVFSLAFAVALFFLVPLGIVGLVHRWLPNNWSGLVLEGVVRLALLIGYLWLIGQLREIQHVFAYHGAEHKSINAMEAGEPLDVTHVRAASRVHIRCGTGFLLIVMIVSILVFALLGNPPIAWRILSRIVLVPVIAAISYELLRLGAAYYRFRIVRWLMAPSLALQGMTTREPNDSQIECAIVALERVLRTDGVEKLQPVA